jgi:hypothetical protein
MRLSPSPSLSSVDRILSPSPSPLPPLSWLFCRRSSPNPSISSPTCRSMCFSLKALWGCYFASPVLPPSTGPSMTTVMTRLPRCCSYVMTRFSALRLMHSHGSVYVVSSFEYAAVYLDEAMVPHTKQSSARPALGSPSSRACCR